MMQSFPATYVIRHRRENLKKCSLRGLEARPDFKFFPYPNTPLPILTSYVMLAMDGEPLQPSDKNCGLLVLDATWRYAEKMAQFVENQVFIEKRSIPSGFRTAYPRRQEDCPSPEAGLASIEAIYIAYFILRRNVEGLLDSYYWKNSFLQINHELFYGSKNK